MLVMRRIRGFTLVELSIVLVIISVLIVSAIKGTSILQEAKVSNAITLAQDLTVAVNTFKQQYHMLPGDMSITTEVPNVRTECTSGSNAGNNDGLIDATESLCVPEVLFQAGLTKVDQDNAWAVFKSYYGSVTVKAVSKSNVSSGFLPSITHLVEFADLPCEVAQEIDRKIDNDDLASGKAIAAGVAAGATCAASSIVAYYAVAL